MAPTQQIRPWRHLGAFLAIVVVLYALVFFTGDRKPLPKLGIDLQGGTQVTLTARTPNGQPPTRDQLVQARSIINDRVNGLGISGAQVVQNGVNLVITVPGDQGRQAKDLAQTALLRIRPVIDGPVQSPPPGTPGVAGAGSPRQPGSGTGGTPGPGSAAPHGHFTLPEAPKPPPPPPPGGGTASDTQMETQIALAKGQRQNPALLTNPVVRKQALDKLQCGGRDILSGYDDPTKPLVSCDPKSREKYVLAPTLLEGTQIANASSGRNDQGVGFIVNLTFDGPGTRTWGDFTTQNVGKLAAFVLDGEVVSAPQINGPIVGGATKIEGNFSQAEAQHLAGVLKYGSLPLSFATSDARTVSATLGLVSLEAGLVAGAIGLALVFVYCLFYYRALGVLTILSLALSGAIVYAVLVLLGRGIGFTLDLSGVAGFIVSIGITADSFVIYFERLKDEVREGSQLPVRGTSWMGPGPAHDPDGRRGELPRFGGVVHPGHRRRTRLRVHARYVNHSRPGGGLPGHASAGVDGEQLAVVLQPGLVRLGAVARIGAQKRRAAAAAAAAARGA